MFCTDPGPTSISTAPAWTPGALGTLSGGGSRTVSDGALDAPDSSRESET